MAALSQELAKRLVWQRPETIATHGYNAATAGAALQSLSCEAKTSCWLHAYRRAFMPRGPATRPVIAR